MLEQSRRYVDDRTAANFIGWTAEHLRNLRARRKGPPWVKNGRSVRYDVSDLEAWMEARKVRPEERGEEGKIET